MPAKTPEDLPLTPKQEAFVREYLVDLNALQAAIRAGYSANPNTAGGIGFENLAKPHIQKALREAMNARAERTEVTADRVLLELARLAFSRMDDYTTWGPAGVSLKHSEDLTEEQARAVMEVTESTSQRGHSIRFKLCDKTRALELIARHLGMLTDRAELTGPGGGPIEIRELTDTDLLERAQAQSNRIAILMAAHRKRDGNGNGSRPGP